MSTATAAPVVWQNRIVAYHPAFPLDQLTFHPRNPKIHPRAQTEAVKGIIGEVGWVMPLLRNITTGYTLDGHNRMTAAGEAVQTTAPLIDIEVSEDEELYILSTFDPVGALAATDSALLADLLADVQTGDAAVQRLLDGLAADGGFAVGTAPGLADADDPDADAPLLTEALFSSDNEWGIPTLDLKRQATAVAPPCERWGRFARHGGGAMPGTWHFYTEDYKFRALWDDPAPVPLSGCVAAIEPNWSTYTAMPPALALYGVYRKRWLARWWQQQGVAILVDLNVEPQFERLNLLGVPAGWRAYATRAYDGLLPDADRQFALAAAHAGTEDLLFVVLGGGRAMQEYAGARGWVWVPQENHVVEGRYGTGE